MGTAALTGRLRVFSIAIELHVFRLHHRLSAGPDRVLTLRVNATVVTFHA